MAEKKQMILNRLPAPTWNWLRVNRTVLDWENENEIDLGAVVRSVQGKENEPLRLEIHGEGEYSRKDVDVAAEPDSAVTIIETFGAEQNLLVRTHLTARRNATIRLVQIQNTQEGSRLVSAVEGECEEGGRIELYQVLAGKGDVYGDSKIELNGDSASFEAETGYLARKQQKVDINLVVNHRGKHTECEINAAGALMDAFVEAAKQAGREKVTLTCKKRLIGMYEHFGFRLIGQARSEHGGAQWFDMDLDLR